MLAAGVFMVGVAGSVFTLARQTFLIEAVPFVMRARAFSTLAGSMRIGVFIGPFAGAALIQVIGLQGAYWVALMAMAGVGWLALLLPDLETSLLREAAPVARPTLIERRFAIMPGSSSPSALAPSLVSALRASRQVVIPLWADHLGISPADRLDSSSGSPPRSTWPSSIPPAR